jgi:hypothetical protein
MNIENGVLYLGEQERRAKSDRRDGETDITKR